jgi:glutamate 5-kinase
VFKMQQYQVIKIGTSSIFRDGAIDNSTINHLGKDLAKLLYENNTYSILVTSGAIPLGMKQKGILEKPVDTLELQSCARIGQPLLMQAYTAGLKEGFNSYIDEKGIKQNLLAAQFLVTYHNLEDPVEIRNIEKGLYYDAKTKTIPIINYNDGVDPTEVTRDNDNLAARIAKAVHADRLIILTDVDGLLDKNGKIIYRVNDINENIRSLAGAGSGTGGMKTKIDAAEILLKERIPTLIGNVNKSLVDIIQDENARTLIQK